MHKSSVSFAFMESDLEHLLVTFNCERNSMKISIVVSRRHLPFLTNQTLYSAIKHTYSNGTKETYT